MFNPLSRSSTLLSIDPLEQTDAFIGALLRVKSIASPDPEHPNKRPEALCMAHNAQPRCSSVHKARETPHPDRRNHEGGSLHTRQQQNNPTAKKAQARFLTQITNINILCRKGIGRAADKTMFNGANG